MGKLSLRLRDDLHSQSIELALGERRSLNAMLNVLIERGIAAGPEFDTPETVAAKAANARAIAEAAERAFKGPDPKPEKKKR